MYLSDLERFTAAMDGEWRVERFELEADRLHVYYRSLLNPLITWSHLPFWFDQVAPVGTVGCICFQWERTPRH